MTTFNGVKDARLIESSIARWGEPVEVFVAGAAHVIRTEAIPSYEDYVVQLPNGATEHLEGWTLTFRPTEDYPRDSQINWRGLRWKINDSRMMHTKTRYMITQIPTPPE